MSFIVSLTGSEGLDTASESFDVTRFTPPVGDHLIDAVKDRVRFRVAAAVLEVPGLQHEQLGLVFEDPRRQPLQPHVETHPLLSVQDVVSATNDEAGGLRGAVASQRMVDRLLEPTVLLEPAGRAPMQGGDLVRRNTVLELTIERSWNR